MHYDPNVHTPLATVPVFANSLAPGMILDGGGVDTPIDCVWYDLDSGMIVTVVRFPDDSTDEWEFYVDESAPVYRRSLPAVIL